MGICSEICPAIVSESGGLNRSSGLSSGLSGLSGIKASKSDPQQTIMTTGNESARSN